MSNISSTFVRFDIIRPTTPPSADDGAFCPWSMWTTTKSAKSGATLPKSTPHPSGSDLKSYAERAGKVYTTLSTKVKAWRVASVTHVSNEAARDSWRNLAEIHAAPKWL